jgi:hypothetical protein
VAAVERLTASKEANQGRRRHRLTEKGSQSKMPRYQQRWLSRDMVGGECPGHVVVRAMALAGLTMDGHSRANSAGFAWSGPWTGAVSCLPSCNKRGGLHALVMQLARRLQGQGPL